MLEVKEDKIPADKNEGLMSSNYVFCEFLL